MRAKFIFENIKEGLLNENPNAILDPKQWKTGKKFPNIIEYNDTESIPFGYYGPSQTLIVGHSNHMHLNLLKTAGKRGLLKSKEDLKERGPNSGRIYPDEKVITFWNFPRDLNELKKVIKDLENDPKIKTFIHRGILNDPEWLIEIPTNKSDIESEGSWGSWKPRAEDIKFIPINHYKGGHKRSAEELRMIHIQTPEEKERRKREGLDYLNRNYGSTMTGWDKSHNIRARYVLNKN
jgi:hypothetical protein